MYTLWRPASFALHYVGETHPHCCVLLVVIGHSQYCGMPHCVTAPSTVDGRLYSFQLFAIKNSAGMKILVHDFLWAFMLVIYLGILGNLGVCLCSPLVGVASQFSNVVVPFYILVSSVFLHLDLMTVFILAIWVL